MASDEGVGLNTERRAVEDDDLHGASVTIAKRLESEAATGGILVSDVVRQAVAGKDFEFEDRGEVELKGFDRCNKQTEVEHRRASRGAPILSYLGTERHRSGFAVPRVYEVESASAGAVDATARSSAATAS